MQELLQSKKAQTQYPVADFISGRFSPRVFSTQDIEDEVLKTLFEAASWSASSSNLQPWRYLYAHRGSSEFQRILECLNPSNQTWAKDAAVLLVSLANTRTAQDKNNRFAMHDLGMANATLLLQAQTMGIYGRMMGGYQQDALREAFHVPETYELGVVIAIGYLGSIEGRDEQFVQREKAQRARKIIAEFAFSNTPFEKAD